MVQYKFSSQFTDLVLACSKNPEEVLAEIGKALEHLGEIGNLSSNVSGAAGTFHETIPSISDEEIMDTIHASPQEKARIVNNFYWALNRVVGTGVSKRTRDYIELFLEGKVSRTGKKVGPVFNPIPVPGSDSPTVIKRGPRGGSSTSGTFVPPVVPPPSASPRFERDEDRMISILDRKRKKASVLELFVKVGILEKVPSIDERLSNIDQRKRAWAKMLSFTYGLVK